MNFFDHKDLGNHLLQLCPKVVKQPVYVYVYVYIYICIYIYIYDRKGRARNQSSQNRAMSIFGSSKHFLNSQHLTFNATGTSIQHTSRCEWTSCPSFHCISDKVNTALLRSTIFLPLRTMHSLLLKAALPATSTVHTPCDSGSTKHKPYSYAIKPEISTSVPARNSKVREGTERQ